MNTVSSQSRNTNSVSNQATQFKTSSKGSSSLAAKFDNISFTPPATLKQNFIKVAEQHTKAIREVATQGVGFVKGVGEVIGETVSGLYTLGKNSAATYIDIVEGGKLDLADKIISTTTGHKIERPEWMPNRQRGVERLEQGGKVLQGVIENPKVLWQAVADPIKEDWNAGRYGEAVGRGTAEVAGIFLGSKGMDKLSAANKAAKTVSRLDDAASVYKKEHIQNTKFNHQGVPLDLVNDVATYMGKTTQEVEKMYDSLKNTNGIDYNSYLDKAVNNNQHGITKEDAHYVFAYTTNLFYEKMNQELRTTGKLNNQAGENLYNKLVAALNKLPDSPNKYYRHLENLTDDITTLIDNKYKKGNVVTERAFLSAADSPSPDYQNGLSRTFIINATHAAKDISEMTLNTELASKIGANPMNKEVVIIPPIEVKVMKNINDSFYLDTL